MVLFVNHVYNILVLNDKIINIACPQEYTALELLQVIESLTGLSAKYHLAWTRGAAIVLTQAYSPMKSPFCRFICSTLLYASN